MRMPWIQVLMAALLGAAQGIRAETIRLPDAADVPSREPPPEGEEPPPGPLDRVPRFLGERDDDVLARICGLPLVKIQPLGGGASISLKGVLSDGSKVAIKPDQERVTNYNAEIAAYRVSRALGIGKVAPSCLRRFPKEMLMAGMPRSLLQRMEKEIHADDKGLVSCAVIAWVPNLRGLRLEKASWWQPLLKRGMPLLPQHRRRILDISTLLLFDFLIINGDRWSGGNTHASGETMVFLDQGAGFGRDRKGRRKAALLQQLRTCQRFDREVYEGLVSANLAALKEDLSPYLSAQEIREFVDRYHSAREYLERLHREAPEDSLLR